MKEFDILIKELETYDAVILEHCKVGTYYGAFNILQKEILRTFYENHLRKLPAYNFGDLDNTPLMMMLYNKLQFIMKYVGEELCKRIPDEKTLNYTESDLDNWAKELYKIFKG